MGQNLRSDAVGAENCGDCNLLLPNSQDVTKWLRMKTTRNCRMSWCCFNHAQYHLCTFYFSLLKVCYLEDLWTCPGHEICFVAGVLTRFCISYVPIPSALTSSLFSIWLSVPLCILLVRCNHVTLGLLVLGVRSTWCFFIVWSNPDQWTLTLFTYTPSLAQTLFNPFGFYLKTRRP